jgi:hypothetical protein
MPLSVRRLPALPATGPMPEQFSTSGRGTHKEGLVLQVTSASGVEWIGNFQPGPLEMTGAWAHPNGRDVVVVAGGELFVVDAETRRAHEIPQTHVRAALEVKSPPTLVLSDDYTLLGFGEERNWRTRRLAWDGIQRLAAARARSSATRGT